jgi:hypothetical protein
VDGSAGKVYWSRGAEIRRANLDGSDNELLLDAQGTPQYLVLDPPNGWLYVAFWSGTDGDTGMIRRVDLDGLNQQVVIANIRNGPIGIAVDVAGGKIYWTRNNDAAQTGRIQRANLDGTDVETLLAGIDPSSIALDLDAGKIYWNTYIAETDARTIERANLDGSDYEVLPLTGIHPGGITIVPDEIPCPGDLDGDLDVDLSDLATLLPNYGMTSGATYADGDIDGDGDVDLSDLAALLGVYGTTCD